MELVNDKSMDLETERLIVIMFGESRGHTGQGQGEMGKGKEVAEQ